MNPTVHVSVQKTIASQKNNDEICRTAHYAEQTLSRPSLFVLSVRKPMPVKLEQVVRETPKIKFAFDQLQPAQQKTCKFAAVLDLPEDRLHDLTAKFVERFPGLGFELALHPLALGHIFGQGPSGR